MEFKGYRESIQIYDAQGNPIDTWVEVRVHPITGEIARVINVPIRSLEPPNLEKMARETREACPFCPEHLYKKTPAFDPSWLPGGMLKRSKAVLIPNRFPYDRYCALIILSDRHYVPLEAWEAREIFDGLSLAQDFLRRVVGHDPAAQAFSLNWNYAPHAGSSILHPHMQLSVGRFATNRARRLLMASQNGMLEGQDLFAEMLEEERVIRERWCGMLGSWHQLFAFAPRGRFFELTLINETPGCFSELEETQIQALSEGVVRGLRFVSAMGFSSMNLSLFSPLREAGMFHPMASISPRACVGPYQMSDISFQMLIDEFFALFLPEEIAARYRETVRGNSDA